MKFFKKQPVAIAVMILAILLSIGIGFVKGPPSSTPKPDQSLDANLDTAYYERYIYDQADVLNSSAEKQLATYLANWDARYNSVVAFLSVDSVTGDPEDYAWGLAADYDLGGGDALLLVVKRADDYRFVWGGDFDAIINTKTADRLAATMDSGAWQSCVLSFYATLNDIYLENFGTGNGTGQGGASYNPGHRTSYASLIVLVVIFAIIVILCLSAIERSRYNAYRRQYYGVVNPPVVFRPIFFWHGPRSSWYRRNWRQPPPSPGGRGPGGFGSSPFGGPSPSGGARPGGTSRPSGSAGGFGGAGNRGPRGTGFGSGGGSFGGTRGSGSRSSGSSFGGSFGGTRSSGSSFGGTRSGGSFGGTRSGGFGGSRSGGSFGGSRGGSFGGSRGGGFSGGSRGGSFGGRR